MTSGEEERDYAEIEGSGVAHRMSPGVGTAILGGLAALLVIVGLAPAAQALLWVEIPVTSLLFVGCVWVVLACPDDTLRAAPGLLLAAFAAAAAWLRLGVMRDHPWLG